MQTLVGNQVDEFILANTLKLPSVPKMADARRIEATRNASCMSTC